MRWTLCHASRTQTHKKRNMTPVRLVRSNVGPEIRTLLRLGRLTECHHVQHQISDVQYRRIGSGKQRNRIGSPVTADAREDRGNYTDTRTIVHLHQDYNTVNFITFCHIFQIRITNKKEGIAGGICVLAASCCGTMSK